MNSFHNRLSGCPTLSGHVRFVSEYAGDEFERGIEVVGKLHYA